MPSIESARVRAGAQQVAVGRPTRFRTASWAILAGECVPHRGVEDHVGAVGLAPIGLGGGLLLDLPNRGHDRAPNELRPAASTRGCNLIQTTSQIVINL